MTTYTPEDYVCDFCSTPGPTMVWSTCGGRVAIMGVNEVTHRATRLVNDDDGMWAACADCHEAVIRYQESKVKSSALKRFVRDVWGRLVDRRQFESSPHLKTVKAQQKVLFERLLPMFKEVIPFEVPDYAPIKQGEEPVKEYPPFDMVIPPHHIPDGSARARRF